MPKLPFPSKTKRMRAAERVKTHPLLYSYHYARFKLFNLTKPPTIPSYVFMLSTGRCGTQTLAALFGIAKNTFAFHEPQPRMGRLSKLAYMQDSPASNEMLAEAFAIARHGLMQTVELTGKHYVEAAHYNTFLAPTINHALPDAKFIHVVRNPVAVVSSAAQRRWYAGNIDDPTRIQPRPGSDVPWESYNTVQKNAWSWAETNRWITEFSSTLKPEQFLLVQAEDIFAGKREIIERLYAFTGIPQPSEKQIERVLGNKLNARPQSESPGKKEQITAEIWDMTQDVAAQLGYDRPVMEESAGKSSAKG